MRNLSAGLPLERSVLVVRTLVFLERFLAIEELVTALVGAWEKHNTIYIAYFQQMYLL